MEFTVNKLDVVVDGKYGYAFLDKEDYCICIVYGDKSVKYLEEILKT